MAHILNTSTLNALTLLLTLCSAATVHAELRVGAARVDITPQQFPVEINGGHFPQYGNPTDIHARAIVIDDGRERVAIVVTDSCLLPKRLLDDAKRMAKERVKISPDRMLISATHTHSAPSVYGEQEATYGAYLRIKLVEAMVEAERNLAPAQVGWGSIDAAEFTALRRWVLAADQMQVDPFGNRTVRASMHTARNNLPNVTGESGPEDPELAMISFQSLSGKPIALLSNFSMHYFEGGGSADYFGAYCDALESHLGGASDAGAEFVAVMSHGCSGDIWRVDYHKSYFHKFDEYVDGMVAKTLEALEPIDYQANASLKMEQIRLPLDYRTPDQQRLSWAQAAMKRLDGKPPTTLEDLYAQHQFYLHEQQNAELVLQAIRIGDIAIAANPCEMYALSGLKIKRRSPLEKTMIIELANGAEGYVPQPEQHVLGGYNTWEKFTAGLEITAEPKIVAALVRLLEEVADRPRRKMQPIQSEIGETIRSLQPVRHFPLNEMEGPFAEDDSAHPHDAIYEDGVLFFLEGVPSPAVTDVMRRNRAAHFAGGRIVARTPELQADFSVSLWVWNGIDFTGRPQKYWLVSRDHANDLTPDGVHLGIGPGDDGQGKLVLQSGAKDEQVIAGSQPIRRWTWTHVALVKAQSKLQVYLNGEMELELDAKSTSHVNQIFLGGRSDNLQNFEGRLDEIAIFERALQADEIKKLAKK